MHRRIAAYSGSFRPLHNGHLDVIRRTAAVFDELVVIVAVNSGKQQIFSVEDRMEMIRVATADLGNVSVVSCAGRYAARVASEQGAQTLIRGIRNGSDLAAEIVLANQNRLIAPDMDTFFVPSQPEFSDVSSTLVWQHVGADPGWESHVSRLVPQHVLPHVRRYHVRTRLEGHWAALMRVLGEPACGAEVFEKLYRMYTQPHRAYHEASHILAMLDEYAELGKRPDAHILLAIWYHDCIYETRLAKGDKSNEEQSADEFANDWAALGLAATDAAIVRRLIMATQHAALPHGEDEQLLVDLDLAILGKPEDVFDRYEAGIRAEYAWVPEADFRSGRARILQTFLDRPFIFSSEAMRGKYEARARANLARSVAALVG